MIKLSDNVSEEFLDWLLECPYQWHLNYEDDDILRYTFVIKKKSYSEDKKPIKMEKEQSEHLSFPESIFEEMCEYRNRED